MDGSNLSHLKINKISIQDLELKTNYHQLITLLVIESFIMESTRIREDLFGVVLILKDMSQSM